MQSLSPHDVRHLLEAHGLTATSQRVIVASCVLNTDAHPTAEDVWRRVREVEAGVSQATVYNTLSRLVDLGLLAQVQQPGDRVRYDANVQAHHHLVDRASGTLHDVDASAVGVTLDGIPDDFEVEEVRVFIFGRRRAP